MFNLKRTLQIMEIEPASNICDICGAYEPRKIKYLQHMSKCRRTAMRTKRPKAKKDYKCIICHKNFSRHLDLENHSANSHSQLAHFRVAQLMKRKVAQHGGSVVLRNKSELLPFIEIHAFKGYVRSYRHSCKKSAKTLNSYFFKYCGQIENILKKCLLDLKCLKSQISVKVEFKRFLCNSRDGNDVYEYQHKMINSNMLTILNPYHSLNRFMNMCASKIQHSISIFETYESGWQFSKVLGSDIRVGKYKPFKGGYWKNLPNHLQNKKATVNLKTKGNYCFKWAVLAGLYRPKRNKSRASSYKKWETLHDFKCVKYPVSVSSIPKFELVNYIAVNIFQYSSKDGLLPLHISKLNYTSAPTVNLLLIFNSKTNESHYVTIRDINRLLGKHNNHKRLLCYNCLNRFPHCKDSCSAVDCDTECILRNHRESCDKFEYQKIKMPNPEDGNPPFISFENYSNQLKAGYVMYADFECLLKKIYARPPFTNTLKEKRHIPTEFSYVLVKHTGELVTHRVYRGKDAIHIFLQDCLRIGEEVRELYSINVPVKMDECDEKEFQEATECHICNKPFGEGEDRKCRDHNHLDGKFRGASHQNCNFNFKQKHILPVLMHNLQGYDHHLIIRGLNNIGKEISVIPNNLEKYMSVTVDSVRFIDSMQFLNCGLSELVENLTKGPETGFSLLSEVFGPMKADMLKRKGVFPYDYIDSWSKFKEVELPPRRKFYNTLTNSHISIKDYKYAKRVYKEFNVRNLGDYHDLYLLTDALLLACVFEEFRSMSLNCFKLDPALYFSLPGLAWDAALKMSGVQLELITDIDIYIFLEQGMRGGISQISQRYARANNKYMKNFRGNVEDSNQIYIVLWDMVNLYGKAMQELLPVSGFKFLEKELIDQFDIGSVDVNAEFGFILQVDIDYPRALHLSHQCYPLACEKTSISTSQFSSYQRKLLSKLPITYMDDQVKLVSHFNPRKNYIVHAANLKYYQEKGLIITKIHKILTFRQTAWLKSYVDFNSAKRLNAKNEFDRMFHKLCVNAVFGKGMESVRNRLNIRLINNKAKALKLIANAQFLSHDILDSNLVCFNMQKNTVILNKAIYTGFCVLELSKLHMARFHYDYVKEKWGEKAKLLMTDTDSLSYAITTTDVYQDISNDLSLFDTSNLPASSPLYSTKNAGVIGKMKDEVKGQILRKYVGLAPKSYCFLGEKAEKQKNSTFKKMAMKGIPQRIQKKHITFKMMERALFDQNAFACNINTIRSYKHKIYNICSTKAALHAFDSKRYVLDDGISTLPYGHFKIP